MTRVTIAIDRLVLEGLPDLEAAALSGALRSSLEASLRDPAALASLERRRGGDPVSATVQGRAPTAIGAALARSIVGGTR